MNDNHYVWGGAVAALADVAAAVPVSGAIGMTVGAPGLTLGALAGALCYRLVRSSRAPAPAPVP